MTDNVIWSVLIVLIWHGFGWGMLIYYTGFKNIDPVLYEAATIDGADQKTTFLKITLPLMKPVIQVNVTMAVISAIKQMETVYLLTNGGPGNSTQFAANYLYQQAFRSFRWYGWLIFHSQAARKCLQADFSSSRRRSSGEIMSKHL